VEWRVVEVARATQLTALPQAPQVRGLCRLWKKGKSEANFQINLPQETNGWVEIHPCQPALISFKLYTS
jgi:hypothetical protein